jgi:phosphatidylglycerophosphate synthase
MNSVGIFLLIIAEALDSADGQLARMTNTKSRIGRILDGFGGNIWFISIYLHLGFRLMNEGASGWIFLLILLCGISHSLQSAMADYYRNFYLFFVFGKNKSEVDESKEMSEQYNRMSWSGDFFNKFLMRVYVNYTIEQEFFAKKLRRLYHTALVVFSQGIPEWFSGKYRMRNLKRIKYYNILTTNTRMIVLFIAIIIKQPLVYFLFEIVVLNIILIYTVLTQEKISQLLLKDISGVK